MFLQIILIIQIRSPDAKSRDNLQENSISGVSDLFQNIGALCKVRCGQNQQLQRPNYSQFCLGHRSHLINDQLWSARRKAERLPLKVLETVLMLWADLEGVGSQRELPELSSFENRTGDHSKGRRHNEDVEVACEEYPDFCSRTNINFFRSQSNRKLPPSWFSVIAGFPWFSAVEMAAGIDLYFGFGLVILVTTWLARFALVNLVIRSFNTASCSTLDRRLVRQQRIWIWENKMWKFEYWNIENRNVK